MKDREKAIKMLKAIKKGNYLSGIIDIPSDESTAFDMAIKALEQEPYEDCISRKALLERINNAEENFKSDSTETVFNDVEEAFVNGVLNGVFDIKQMVVQAPPVTPQQKYALSLDMIRAEIEKQVLESLSDCGDDWFAAEKVNECLEIIDRYKTVSEGIKMQVVIEIDNKLYEIIKNSKKLVTMYHASRCAEAVRNGTPLPKGHGKLKDTDKISDELERLRDSWNYYGNEYESGNYEGYDHALDEVLYAPTIIEADKEG